MASATPKKSVSDKILNLCRCCNRVGTASTYRVPLFGCKSESEGLVAAIVHFTELCISENDSFSKWVCRNCESKILTIKKKIQEMKTLCKETVRKQEQELASSRTKRGRKDEATGAVSPLPTSSPAVASSNVPKRTRLTQSGASRSLTGIFQSIAPKPPETRANNPSSCPIQSVHPPTSSKSQQQRILPASFQKRGQNQSTISPQPAESEEVSLLSTCTLDALKVQNIFLFH